MPEKRRSFYGRPPKPEDQVKRTFAMRLSSVERKAVDDAAKRAGLPSTVWAREALLAAARRLLR